MINPKGLGTAAAIAVVVSIAAPSAGFAQYKANNGGNVGEGYHPLMRAYRPGFVAAPTVGANRAAPFVPQLGVVHRGGYGGERDRDRSNERAFVAGAVTGAILRGAVASQGYYYGAPAYYAPGYYGDQYYNGGTAIVPAPAADAIAWCIQTYSSYDPQSGTYIGDDGNAHPCPP
jgi:hypothetical protein